MHFKLLNPNHLVVSLFLEEHLCLELTDLNCSAKCCVYSQNPSSCACLGRFSETLGIGQEWRIAVTAGHALLCKERCWAHVTRPHHTCFCHTGISWRSIYYLRSSLCSLSCPRLPVTTSTLAFCILLHHLKASEQSQAGCSRELCNYYLTDNVYDKWTPLIQKPKQSFLVWENQQELGAELILLGQPSAGQIRVPESWLVPVCATVSRFRPTSSASVQRPEWDFGLC